MRPLRVAVVDDEPLAREGLAEQLAAFAGIVVAGVHPDGPAALAALLHERVDALFVDIRMPGMSGIELAEALEGPDAPAVVFVTAYDEHAIRAFELNAADYLLKPVTADRLAQTLDRLRARDPLDPARAEQMAALLDALAPGRARGAGRLIVREVGQVIVVPTLSVDWIEGADYYAKLHIGPKVHLLRESLASLEQRLDPARFMRIHRSVIVNLARVRVVEAEQRGAAIAILSGGARLRVTAARREALEQALEQLHDTA